jgi:hypothetical protein
MKRLPAVAILAVTLVSLSRGAADPPKADSKFTFVGYERGMLTLDCPDNDPRMWWLSVTNEVAISVGKRALNPMELKKTLENDPKKYIITMDFTVGKPMGKFKEILIPSKIVLSPK